MRDAMSDPCDFLTPEPTRPDPAASERIFGRTLGVLRRRRWLRRAGWAISLAACFAAGVTVTLAMQPAPKTVTLIVEREKPLPTPATATPEPQPAPFVAESDRPRALRQAGDRLLADEDPLAAVHCYTRALDADNDELTITTDDSWLLLAIKDARLKEKRDAKTND
jgi:hypothetical protein